MKRLGETIDDPEDIQYCNTCRETIEENLNRYG